MKLRGFLSKTGRVRSPRLRWVWIFLGCVVGGLWGLDRLFPPPVSGREATRALVVLARDGSPLRAFPDQDHVWRQPVTLEQVSPRYLETLLTYEDRHFYHHPGVNPLALLRAAWQWLWHGRIVSGGSTITMQVARVFEPMPRTLLGKFRQALRALQLEWRYSKAEILTYYLNYAPMGGVLEGVEAASRAYLGKSAARLTEAESALLTVIPQAPSRLRPDRHPEAARRARDKVLVRMAPLWGTERVKDAMLEAPYALIPRDPMLAPLLAERLRQGVRKTRSPVDRIQTTLDSAIQTTVETRLADRVGSLPPKVSMAVLVVENAGLEVRAYAGSADFTDATRFNHIDMVQAIRSPGSTLKPFLYGLALDEGLIHSESLLADVPQSFSGYQPGNFQQSFHGPVSVSEALSRSLNVPAVEVLERLEPNRFDALLQRGGLKLELPKGSQPNLSLILGGAGTSLERLVGAYTALARGGQSGTLRLTPEAPLQNRYMMSEGAAFIVRDILESGGPNGRATERGSGVQRGIAWKTGTSFGFRDAWAVGVSDQYTIGVWVGRPDGAPNPGYFGANVAAPFLVDLFDAIDGAPPVPRIPPASVSTATICWPLGTLADNLSPEACHERRTAWLLNGTAPPTFPDRLRSGQAHYTYYVDQNGLRTSPACGGGTKVEAVRWPAALEPWLSAAMQTRALPPPWSPQCGYRQSPEAGLRILGVTAREVLRRTQNGNAPLVRLMAQGARSQIHWLINGTHRAQLGAGQAFLYRFEVPGPYDITAFDEQGHVDRVSVVVE